MVRVVLDTNVLVSALHFGGVPDDLVSLARMGEIQLVISPCLLEELNFVLVNKFGWSDAKTEIVRGNICKMALLVNPQLSVTVIQECDADNRVLECALEGQCRFIISGDKRHLLPLRKFEGIAILNPADFMKKYIAGNL